MKKTLILTAILTLILSVSFVSAATIIGDKFKNTKYLKIESVQTITSDLMDARTVEVLKFVDGSVTCYVTYSSKYPDSTEQISCVK